MRETSDTLISIYPAYADAILAGTKTVEFRRRFPELAAGSQLWIYATRPTAAVVGIATVARVARAHPRTLWNRHRDVAGIDHASFAAYFSGIEEAIGIVLSTAQRIGPIGIERLREIRDCFHPPQVFTHLTTAEATALRRLARK